MTHIVNVYEAKTRLSALLVEVESGGEVVIARAGRPVARLVAADQPGGRRTPGAWRGQISTADDFDVLPEEIASAFTGH